MVDRRAASHPLEHVLGWAVFCGLHISVDPGVFVPRRRTEFLVHHASVLARSPTVAVDLCCGSGAVGAVLAATVDQVAGKDRLCYARLQTASAVGARIHTAVVGMPSSRRE
jgi:release factor glutamine methyltransferase